MSATLSGGVKSLTMVVLSTSSQSMSQIHYQKLIGNTKDQNLNLTGATIQASTTELRDDDIKEQLGNISGCFVKWSTWLYKG